MIAAVPVAFGADSPSARVRAVELPAEGSSAAARAKVAALTLYALGTELTRARADVAAAEARRTTIARERASARGQLELAQHSLRVSEHRLAELVRTLYQQAGSDPLAILLGAGSLEEALTGLDTLNRAAGENRRVLDRAGAAQSRLVQLDARLAAREAELLRASQAARSRLRTLETKAAERSAYIGSLRRHQGLTAQKVSSIEARARAAERLTGALQVSAPPATVALRTQSEPTAPVAVTATPPAMRGQMLSVSAVGYSLQGWTASGLPVGNGIAAVDPSVIPLGTRIFVPGYGEAVAADTGGAVRGATIDLWFPTRAAARRWGRQTVVITLR